jgi:plasmid stabilization system protein ParE
MVDINWTNEAEFWLKDIHDYIAQNNPIIAKKLSMKFIKKFRF